MMETDLAFTRLKTIKKENVDGKEKVAKMETVGWWILKRWGKDYVI